MIKVCHIVNLITGKSDGVYAHLKMIFQNHDREKYQHYLIFQGGEKIEKEITSLRVKVFVLPSLKEKFSFGTFGEIYQIIKKYDFDILHTHLIKSYIIVGLINIITRKKFIFNYHGIFIANNPYYSEIEKVIYRLMHEIVTLFDKPDIVLVPSKKSKELLMNETKLFPEPLIYYNGYDSRQSISNQDMHLISKLSQLKTNNFVIAVIGRLEIQKRIDNAIKLFSSVASKRSNLILLVFGDGSLKNELIDLCKILEVELKVIFFDFVPNISNYFKYFDVIIFTSDWEGLPLTVWEAMVNKIPVIAPDVGGFREILEENSCGIIYKPGNLKEAEEKILQLIDNIDLRNNLGENSKTAIDDKYTSKHFINQIEKVYQDLLTE